MITLLYFCKWPILAKYSFSSLYNSDFLINFKKREKIALYSINIKVE